MLKRLLLFYTVLSSTISLLSLFVHVLKYFFTDQRICLPTLVLISFHTRRCFRPTLFPPPQSIFLPLLVPLPPLFILYFTPAPSSFLPLLLHYSYLLPFFQKPRSSTLRQGDHYFLLFS
ncbi:hypothetical protein BGX38DRAFT_861132 [Terfezia claveryi]|nr:hypothetical protein BGX38DRAFT_861132 [Terfezia claveryi]